MDIEVSKTYQQLLHEHLLTLKDSEKDYHVHSGVIIVVTDKGLGISTLTPDVNVYSLVGMMEEAKLVILDNASDSEEG